MPDDPVQSSIGDDSVLQRQAWSGRQARVVGWEGFASWRINLVVVCEVCRCASHEQPTLSLAFERCPEHLGYTAKTTTATSLVK